MEDVSNVRSKEEEREQGLGRRNTAAPLLAAPLLAPVTPGEWVYRGRFWLVEYEGFFFCPETPLFAADRAMRGDGGGTQVGPASMSN